MKVYARDAQIAKIMKHPGTNVGFNVDDLSKGATWPSDAFTFRRIKDGTVTTEAPKLAQQPSKNPPPLDHK